MQKSNMGEMWSVLVLVSTYLQHCNILNEMENL